MSELYWISVLGNLSDFVRVALVFLLIIGIALSAVVFYYLWMEGDSESDKFCVIKRATKIILPIFAILLLAEIFIPSTKQMYAIYGVGGTIDYIRQDSTATKLPHKAIVALDKYLETLSEEDKK